MYNCTDLYSSNLSIGIGTFLSITILLSYIPQYYKIIKTKSVYGINFDTILIGNTANLYNFFGIVVLSSWKFNCCTQITIDKCISNIIPTIQMFMPWFSIFIYLLIFMSYNDNTSKNIFNSNVLNNILIRNKIKIWFIIFLLPVIISYIILTYKTIEPTHQKYIFSNIINGISAFLCIIQWIPQIVTTYRNKKLHSLSNITLSIQFLGSLIVFSYQTFVIKEELSIGLPYLFSGFFQLSILLMDRYFKKKKINNYELIVDYN